MQEVKLAEPAKAGNNLTDCVLQSVVDAITIPESDRPDVPVQAQRVDRNYVFQPVLTREICQSLMTGYHRLITGAPGTGKTSAVWQVCLRAGVPVVQYGCKLDSTSDELVGCMALKDGSSVWCPGAVAKAADIAAHIKGDHAVKCVLLLDEIDAAEPGVILGLNSLLDGGFITAGGRVIDCTGVLVVATANTSGMGDETGRWGARRPLDPAILNRFLISQADYIAPEVEEQIIMSAGDKALRVVYPGGEKTMARLVADSLHDIRSSYYDGSLHSDPISTRQAVKLAFLLGHNKGSEWVNIVSQFCYGRTRFASRDLLEDYRTVLNCFINNLPPKFVGTAGFQEEVKRLNGLLDSSNNG